MKTALHEVAADGSFQRTASTFRSYISDDENSEFKPESGRYHLVVSYACPWASRTLAFRSILGLKDVISLSVVSPVWGKVTEEGVEGWVFDTENKFANTIADPYGSKSLREFYFRACPNYTGKFTVPVLFDKKTEKIVNNESSEIIRMFYYSFARFGTKKNSIDLIPEDKKQQIEELGTWMYDSINNGVYRCGFATTQIAYNQAFHQLFAALDEAEQKLTNSRFLCGDKITEADIRLFVTLIRFDVVYYGHFKTNKKHVYEYQNIWGWLRDVYQIPEIKETVNFEHIKNHYYGSHPAINPRRIVPLGPELDFESKHGRESQFS